MKNETKPFFECNLSESIKSEWMFKEEGSFEDAGKPHTHVYYILAHSPKGKVRAYTREAAETLASSAGYHSGAWERREPEVVRFMDGCKRVSKALNEALSK